MKQEEIITFRLFNGGEIPISLNGGVTILYGLHGVSNVHTGMGHYRMEADEVCVISPFMMYYGDCQEDAGLLSIMISEDILKMAGWEKDTAVSCYLNKADQDNSLTIELKQRCAKIFHMSMCEVPMAELANLVIELLAFLQNNFSIAKGYSVGNSKAFRHLESALFYIQEHYSEPISLERIACRQSVSESYLSRLFQKYLHMTYTEYLVSIRLDHAAAMLRRNEMTVTEIAYENGFSSVNAFIQYFRVGYGETPGRYRAKYEKQGSGRERLCSDWMEVFLQYDKEKEPTEEQDLGIIRESVKVDVTQERESIRQSWKKIINIGFARDGLAAAVQQQIRQAKKDWDFSYLRFRGIFDDDMHIYQENEEGQAYFDFTYADMLFDFIEEIDALPFVELSYMPSKLAKEQYRIFERHSIFSMYHSAQKWQELLLATLRHWITRYGIETVRRWCFTILSFNHVLVREIPISYEEYLEMHLLTWRTLKSVDSRLQMGAPGNFIGMQTSDDEVKKFLADLKKEQCEPDFFAVQCYPHEKPSFDRTFLRLALEQSSVPAVLSGDEDFLSHSLEQFENLLAECGMQKREIWVVEWTSTLWQRDLSEDTCFKAAWLFKNVLQNAWKVEGLGYWLLTDFLEEALNRQTLFHGGYGLFTMNGIPKAGYRAFQLLNFAVGRKIDEGENWFMSRLGHSISIFLFHYCHYDPLYRYKYRRIENPYDVYKVFEQSGELHWDIELTGLERGGYTVRRYRISGQYGSSFDQWLNMKAPEMIRNEERKYLIENSYPKYVCEQVTVDGILKLDAQLPPHGVEVILLEKR